MKVAVSYISSNYKLKETIKKINLTSASYIHMDIMDGKYVENKNFKKRTIKKVFKYAKKRLDIHLMTKNPNKYLKYFKKSSLAKNLFFHPSTCDNVHDMIIQIKKIGLSPGIVINPKEKINDFKELYKDIDRVLIMSVIPGAGGQKYKKEITNKIIELIEYRKKHKESFEIAVDGGINDKTIKELKDLNLDYVISGSYICKSNDYEKQIEKLK